MVGAKQIKCPGLSGTENVNKRTNITLDVTSYAEGFTSELLFQPSCLRSVDKGLNLSAMRAVFSAFLGALLGEGVCNRVRGTFAGASALRWKFP